MGNIFSKTANKSKYIFQKAENRGSYWKWSVTSKPANLYTTYVWLPRRLVLCPETRPNMSTPSKYHHHLSFFRLWRRHYQPDFSKLNPGPTIWICSVCNNQIRRNFASVKCNQCNNWCHLRSCSGLAPGRDWDT